MMEKPLAIKGFQSPRSMHKYRIKELSARQMI